MGSDIVNKKSILSWFHKRIAKSKIAKFVIEYEEEFNGEVLSLDWNVTLNQVLIVIKSNSNLKLEIRDTKDWTIKTKGIIATNGNLKSASLHDNSELALLVFETSVILLSLTDYRIKKQIHREDGFLKGGFMNAGVAYVIIPALAGSVDWSYWNYEESNFQEYELERYGHYGRGAVLHPSRKLIGSCWSAYASGLLLHFAIPENGRLQYFNLGDEECYRTEYEAFAPSFNPEGDKFAFIVNPYNSGAMNIEKLCIYDLFNQQSPMFEIQLTHYREESVRETFFLGDNEYILLRKTCAVDIVDLIEMKVYRVTDNDINCIATNSNSKQFMVSIGNKIRIYHFCDSTNNVINNTDANSLRIADIFISNYSSCLKIASDEIIHISTAISALHEIPKVYVKYGFEKAEYRLDTKEVIKETLSDNTKHEVNTWFALNQKNQLSQWKENNKYKQRFQLLTPNNEVIEIFSGKRSLEPYPNIRVYYQNYEWMIDIEKKAEIDLLPVIIREQIRNWIDTNYKEIIRPWERISSAKSLKR